MKPPWWVRPLRQVLLRGVWPTQVHGAAHVPAAGGVLYASNHLGLLDGPLLVGASPRWTQCLVKSEMFHGPIGALLRATGQIPVQRGTGDRAALNRALAVLRDGGVVGVFPEGTRGRGDGGAVRLGVAWLALQSGAPVVPVACLGTRRTGESTNGVPRFRRHLDVVFGAPIRVVARQGVPGRVALSEAGETVQEALAEHVSQAVSLTGQPLPDDLGWSDEELARGDHQ